jgi:hypothetical protein
MPLYGPTSLSSRRHRRRLLVAHLVGLEPVPFGTRPGAQMRNSLAIAAAQARAKTLTPLPHRPMP